MAIKKEKSTDYQLSEESSKTSREFGYATRTASALKNALSPMVFDKYGNSLHKRLLARIIAVLNQGPAAKKGKRTLADGHMQLLKGMELNPHANFSSLTYSLTAKAEIIPASGDIKVHIPELETTHFKWPERATNAYLQIRSVVLDPKRLTFDCYALDPLNFGFTDKKLKARKATIPISDMDDRLVLLAMGVSFLRTDSEGFDGLISHNRKYYAAYILEAVYVKDGKIVVFEEEQHSKSMPESIPPNVKTVKWDEG